MSMATQTIAHVALPVLADAEGYEPNTFHYTNKAEDGMPKLKDWINVFRKSIKGFKGMAEKDNSVSEAVRQLKADEFETRIKGILDMLDANPDAEIPGFGSAPVNCVRLCTLRDECLRQAGFWDPYRAVKAQENANALKLLGNVLEELDLVTDPRERMESALKGVFAGNIFDLGAAASTQLYEEGGDAGVMFKNAKAQLVSRPWAVDCLDSALDALLGPPYRKAVVFADNAGADIGLGMLPFMRELLKRGTEVVVAVNEVPSINDVTVPEMLELVRGATEADATIAAAVVEGRLRVVSSGNDLPVIDLRRVSAEVAREAESADLVVLEGMGRGIETNLYAQLTCDSLKLGMIKHPEVATCLGGRLYDCVCQFQAGTNAAPSAA